MLRLEPYLLRFKTPFRSSKGSLEDRKGYIVRWAPDEDVSKVHVGGRVSGDAATAATATSAAITASATSITHPTLFEAECAPLVDFSKETLEDVKAWFDRHGADASDWIRWMDAESIESALMDAKAPPSIRFALSCLWAEHRASVTGTSIGSILGRDSSAEPMVNGILPLEEGLWSGAKGSEGAVGAELGSGAKGSGAFIPPTTQARILDALGRGITTFKLKCDARQGDLHDWFGELDHKLHSLLEEYPSLRFKLDFNESLPLSQVGLLDSAFSAPVRAAIAYVEDPSPLHSLDDLATLRSSTRLPIALDEPLTAKGTLDAQQVIASGMCDVVILKPMAIGSIFELARLHDLAVRHHVSTVVTTLLEGPVGVAHVRIIASLFGSPGMSHGLDTLGLFEGQGGTASGLGWGWESTAPPTCLLLKSGDVEFTYGDLAAFVTANGLSELRGTALLLTETPVKTALAAAALFTQGIPFIIPAPERLLRSPDGRLQAPETLLTFLRNALGPIMLLGDELHFPSGDGGAFRSETYAERPAWSGRAPESGRAAGSERPPKSIQALRPPESIVAYVQTSGSTGTPKWIPIRFEQILGATRAMPETFHPKPGTVWLNPLPLHHIGGLMGVLRNVLIGAGVRIEGSDELASAFADTTHPVHGASLVATQLNRLLDKPGFTPPASCHALLLGGGPVPDALFETIRQRNLPVFSGYGMTETCAMIAVQDLRTAQEATQVGPIFQPNQWDLGTVEREEEQAHHASHIGAHDGELDASQNAPLDHAHNGAPLRLRGPQIARNAILEIDGQPHHHSLLDAEGWFDTGDIAVMASPGPTRPNESRSRGGTLRILARRTDLILSGGKNIRPEEVEAVLTRLPFIKEAAVIGIPDEEWGQIAVACIVLRDTSEVFGEEKSGPSFISLASMKPLLDQQLAGYKIPKKWIVLPKLPRTSLGKLKRGAIRERVQTLL